MCFHLHSTLQNVFSTSWVCKLASMFICFTGKVLRTSHSFIPDSWSSPCQTSLTLRRSSPKFSSSSVPATGSTLDMQQTLVSLDLHRYLGRMIFIFRKDADCFTIFQWKEEQFFFLLINSDHRKRRWSSCCVESTLLSVYTCQLDALPKSCPTCHY